MMSSSAPSPSTAISPARCLSPQLGLWSKAFIGEDDRVVPPTNQENYWRIQGVPFTHLPKTPHYLLGHFRRWEEFW